MPAIKQEPRISYTQFDQIAPAISTALRAISKVVDESGLEKTLTELIKVRASQLNGCTFCLQFHLNLGRQHALSQAKLDLVAAWREASIFSARERAALAWTEALTLMASQHASDAVYQELQLEFSVTEIAYLTASIGTINFWNRLAGGLAFTPPPATPPRVSEPSQ